MASDAQLTALARSRLSRGGWSESIAGPADSSLVCAAFAAGMRANPKRGALLSGAFGCGKTLAATALYRVEGTDDTWRSDAFSGQVLSCYACETWAAFDADAPYAHRLGWVIFDDLGSDTAPEPNRRDIVSDWLMRLHRHWSAGHGSGLAVTTNLTGAQLAARYGGRFMSRLMEMVVPAALSGCDRRRRVRIAQDAPGGLGVAVTRPARSGATGAFSPAFPPIPERRSE